MRLLPPLALVALVVLSSTYASAATNDNSRGEAKLAKALDGRVAGKPVNCINLQDVRSSEIIDHTAILYHADGDRVYVNVPRIGQTSLNNDDILVTKTWSSQLCNLDTVRLFNRGARFETGFVGLGEFVPYSKTPRI